MGNFDTFKSLKRWFFGPSGVVRPSKLVILKSVPFEVTKNHYPKPVSWPSKSRHEFVIKSQ